MDNWKNKFGGAIQKFNVAGRNFLSTFRQDTIVSNEIVEPEYQSLSFLRDDDFTYGIEIDPCSECDKEFGILTIDDDDGFLDYSFDGEVCIHSFLKDIKRLHIIARKTSFAYAYICISVSEVTPVQ